MLNLLRNPLKNNTGVCLFIVVALFFVVVSCSTKNTPSYQLITSSAPAEAGSVSPASGEHDEGSEVQLQATANSSWMFDGWEGDQTGSQNPVTVTMNADKNISARFVKRQYPLTINVEGNGTVTETVVQNKMTDYQHGSVVEIEAFSSTGYNFVQWTGDLESTENPVQITVDGPKEVTVVFEPMEFSVMVEAEGPGSVSVNPQKEMYEYNETVTIKAIPNNDIQFLGWFNESESFENWTFTWLFDFQGERYEKEQEVGEPSSNAKQKLLLWENIEIRESVSVDIKQNLK